MSVLPKITKKPVKCPFCEKTFVREKKENGEYNFVYYKKRYYHISCMKNKESGASDRTKILNLLEEKWGRENVNYGLVGKQLKNYREQNGFTESGVLGTLDYLFNHQTKVKMDMPKFGIAMVAYKYTEAGNYFKKLNEIKSFKKIEVKEKEIVVLRQQSKRLDKVISLEEELF